MRSIFIRATLLCGTLDALYASVWAILAGGNVGRTWRYVASGPLGDQAKDWGFGGVLAGLGVHFAIMAAMVDAFLFAYHRTAFLPRTNPWILGAIYGLGLYLVMNVIVVPLRFAAPFHPTSISSILIPLVPHIFFIGIPLVLMVRRAQAAKTKL